MLDADLEMLDREVRHAATQLARARDALRAADTLGPTEPAPNPLARHRRVSTRTAHRDLAPEGEVPIPEHGHAPPLLLLPSGLALAGADALALSESALSFSAARPSRREPLRTAIRSWVYALTLERVLWADTVAAEAAWRADAVVVDRPGPSQVRVSPQALLQRILTDPEPACRRRWAELLAEGAGAAADAARVLAGRRAAAARLLVEHPDATEIPVEPAHALAAIADDLLRRTQPLFEPVRGGWQEAVARAVGRDHGEGWPARLGPRWLAGVFDRSGVSAGLELELEPLPPPIGAASFARALAAFGRALAVAGAPESAPFALAHPCFDVHGARRAALFGSLAADAVFGARALGLGRTRARDQARGIARSLLISVRIDAARVLLRDALALPPPERDEQFEAISARAIGAAIPPVLVGLVPRFSAHDGVGFAGLVLAAADRRRFIDQYDDDWFQNPHAARALREQDAEVPRSRSVGGAALDAGLTELVAAFTEIG